MLHLWRAPPQLHPLPTIARSACSQHKKPHGLATSALEATSAPRNKPQIPTPAFGGAHTDGSDPPSQLNAFTTCSSNRTMQPSDQAHCLWGTDPIKEGKFTFSVGTENEKCLYHSLSTSPSALHGKQQVHYKLGATGIHWCHCSTLKLLCLHHPGVRVHVHTQRIERNRLD